MKIVFNKKDHFRNLNKIIREPVRRDLSPTFYTPGSSIVQSRYLRTTTDNKNSRVILKSVDNSVKSFNINDTSNNRRIIKRIIRSPVPVSTASHKYIKPVFFYFFKL